jgi:hypothetical protein
MDYNTDDRLRTLEARVLDNKMELRVVRDDVRDVLAELCVLKEGSV